MQPLHFTAGLSTNLDRGGSLRNGLPRSLQEGEAEETWGVFVGVLKVAQAAAANGAVHFEEAAPPGAGDAGCQAGAPAEAAPAGAAPAGAAPAGAAPAGAARV